MIGARTHIPIMPFDNIEFSVSGEESLPPDERKSADIYSRIGYTIDEALADLVDNSIDAKASNVLIRFMTEPTGIRSILIVDDGDGMDASELKEAMRFGSQTNKDAKQLGKYGIGLKSASLSQASVVTVLSRKARSIIGRRWTTENIGQGWKCQLLDKNGCASVFDLNFGNVDPSQHGSIVIWEHLEHLKVLPENLGRTLDKTIKRISNELGLRFHRFLESEKVRIYIDTQEADEEAVGIQLPVRPLNPFGYEKTGRSGYPRIFRIPIQGKGFLDIDCHIWPAKSSLQNYRLGGGKTAARQGFYFYRNDRLIQAGGWNGCRDDDSEPHLSLARVRVELPAQFDSSFKLDVAKSIVDPPPAFQVGILAAQTDEGTFRQFWLDAQATYRKQKTKDRARFPFIPGRGFPAYARNKIRLAFSEKGVEKPGQVTFKWHTLGHDTVVEIDAGNGEIILNTKFKAELGGGANEGALQKLLLLLVFQQQLSKSFETEKSRDWMHRVNLALLSSLKVT